MPDTLSEQDWKQAGFTLSKIEGAMAWWIGDWWAFGEHQYGDRKAMVESEDWEGTSYDLCRKVAVVCAAFEMFRRRNNLAFSHHQEIAEAVEMDRSTISKWDDDFVKTSEAEDFTNSRDFEPPIYNVWKQRTAEEMLAMGADFQEAKKVCKEDGKLFEGWCGSEECPVSLLTAQRLMAINRELGGKNIPRDVFNNGFKVLASVTQTRDEDIRAALLEHIEQEAEDGKPGLQNALRRKFRLAKCREWHDPWPQA